MALHQRPRIVEQHLLRHPTKMAKRRLDAVHPRRLPLMAERLRVNPPRVAQRRDKQVHAQALAADRHPGLAKIDLQLMPGRCLKSNRRSRLGAHRPAPPRYRPLDRAQARRNPLLARQILAHHVGLAAMLPKPLGQPRLVPVQRFSLAAAPGSPANPRPRHTDEPSRGYIQTFWRSAQPPNQTPSAAASPRPHPASASDPPAAASAARETQPIRPLRAPPLTQRGSSSSCRHRSSFPCRPTGPRRAHFPLRYFRHRRSIRRPR